ncbi:MAG: Wzz/FepE/Etk N-terminal domain-containing protein, partial [Bacteroidota bacterium]
MAQTPQENAFNLLYIFEVIKRRLSFIAIVIGVSALLAIILTLPFIYKPEFKSSTVIYPTAAERYDAINLFHDEPILYLYGESKDVEKLETLANSERIKMFVIDSLDLWKAYGVDPENDAAPKHEVLQTYDGMINTVRISGNGLEIQAYDTDPQRAADIVNLIVDQVDIVNKEMINKNKNSIYSMYKGVYKELVEQMELYTDSARKVRKRYNVLNTETQTEVLAEQILIAQGELASAKASGLGGRARVIDRKLKSLVEDTEDYPLNLESFREGLDQVLSLEEIIEYISRDVKDVREKVEVLEMMQSQDFTTIL